MLEAWFRTPQTRGIAEGSRKTNKKQKIASREEVKMTSLAEVSEVNVAAASEGSKKSGLKKAVSKWYFKSHKNDEEGSGEYFEVEDDEESKAHSGGGESHSHWDEKCLISQSQNICVRPRTGYRNMKTRRGGGRTNGTCKLRLGFTFTRP